MNQVKTTVTSREILDFINVHRKAAGKPTKQHCHLLTKIRQGRLIRGVSKYEVRCSSGTQLSHYALPEKEAVKVLMNEPWRDRAALMANLRDLLGREPEAAAGKKPVVQHVSNIIVTTVVPNKISPQPMQKEPTMTTITTEVKSTLNVPTMSSLDIVKYINEGRKQVADAGGKKYVELRHDNFVTKIESHPGINAPKFLGTQKYGNNNARPCYNLPKREAELMVMSESLAVQTKIYDRMAELEIQVAAPVKPSLPNFEDPIAAAEAWIAVKRAEQSLMLEVGAVKVELALTAPAVAFHDAVVADSEMYTFARAAQLIGMGQNRFIEILRLNSYIKKDRSPYQSSINNGWLKPAYGASEFTTSSGRVVPPTTHVTSKGVVYFQKMINGKNYLTAAA